MTIILQKAMISLNKYERCTCVLRLPGKPVYSAARERICFFNKPVCYFCNIFLNVNLWIGKKLMHYKNRNN